MTRSLDTTALQALLDANETFALLDVREHGEYNTAHIAGASSVPRRQLEFRAHRLIPFTGTAVLVYDEDGRRAAYAGATVKGVGHTDARMLAGGLNRTAWRYLLRRRSEVARKRRDFSSNMPNILLETAPLLARISTGSR